MKQILAGGILLLALSINIQAQWGRPELAADEVKKLNDRITLVTLEDEDSKILKMFANDPSKLNGYKNAIKWYNETIQEVIPKVWKFNPSYEFKSKAEVLELADSKEAKKYSVLFFITYQYKSNSREVSALAINLLENYNSKALYNSHLYWQDFPKPFPRKGDLYMGLQIMQAQLHGRLILSNKTTRSTLDELYHYARVLKTKTLLIDKDEIDKSLTADKIKKQYPYPVEIVDYSVIENAIIERSSKYCYVQIFPSNSIRNAHLVIDSEVGLCIGYSFNSEKMPTVVASDFKEYVQFVKQ